MISSVPFLRYYSCTCRVCPACANSAPSCSTTTAGVLADTAAATQLNARYSGQPASPMAGTSGSTMERADAARARQFVAAGGVDHREVDLARQHCIHRLAGALVVDGGRLHLRQFV